MFTKAKTFFQESMEELRRVNWPSRQETVQLTGVVIFVSVAIAVFLGVLDMIFTYGLEFIIKI
ncbi:MAG: preprotein translocase subunit SecE [bacterium]|nr:preprotein translocase subunit SecE [bacterium]